MVNNAVRRVLGPMLPTWLLALAALVSGVLTAVVEAARAATAGRTVLVVTHDHELASGVDRCVPLEPVSNDPEPRHRRTPPGPAVATPMPVLSLVVGR